MPRLVYLDPLNYRNQYVTARYGDPGIPAGWILTSGSDGAPDAAMITYMGGVNSGGPPPYTVDPLQRADFPNGINRDGSNTPIGQ